jgi:hypothetical protein
MPAADGDFPDLFIDPEVLQKLLEVATAFSRLFRADERLRAELARGGRRAAPEVHAA